MGGSLERLTKQNMPYFDLDLLWYRTNILSISATHLIFLSCQQYLLCDGLWKPCLSIIVIICKHVLRWSMQALSVDCCHYLQTHFELVYGSLVCPYRSVQVLAVDTCHCSQTYFVLAYGSLDCRYMSLLANILCDGA